jgi:hypothetical protein
VDAFDIGAIVAAVVAAIAGVWARKRRKGYVFKPRARVRFYASLRTHESNKTPSTEPPPFEDEKP